jgi:hypothetical protein
MQKVVCYLLKYPLCHEAWIYLLEIWNKQFRYADKSITWKDVSIRLSAALLRYVRQPDLAELVEEECPQPPGPSWLLRPGPVGPGSDAVKQQLAPRQAEKGAESLLLEGKGFPS